MGNIFSSNAADCNLNKTEIVRNEIKKNYSYTQNGSHSVNFKNKALGKNEKNKPQKEIETELSYKEKNIENKIFKFIFSSFKKIKDRKTIDYINKGNHESLIIDKKKSSMSSKNLK